MEQPQSCFVLFLLSIFIAAALMQPCSSNAETCEQWVAQAVSVQGTVEVKRVGETLWQAVKLDDTFCPGDMIRVPERSRADLALANRPLLRLDQDTTITLKGLQEEKTSLIDMLKGAAHFFSRIPRSLGVTTAFVNAGIEGTEFLVKIDESKTSITVYEGKVLASNQAGSLSISSGQSAVAEAGKAPELRVVVRPRDAVQWALYYPPVLYYRLEDFRGLPESAQVMMKQSVEDYMKGDFKAAFESIAGVPEEIRDPRLFSYRAGLLLAVGRTDEANADLAKALHLAPNNSDALALQSIIAVAQNEKGKAMDLAKKAVEADPKSASARIALSYAQQASVDLEGARGTLKEAVRLSPGNALAWARLAEVWLSLGDLGQALQAADEGARLNPNLARTQTILGFAYLMQIKTKTSKEAFEKAITLDQADPLPRLGLGLSMIRDGNLAEGRKEIEVAVSLSPDDALVRSYLGKAYYEEKEAKQASAQYSVAKDLDPSDPTAFFYDAILKQSINRPVEALQDLLHSISLNDNRAVYRSRLLLDADLAARSSSLARTYNDLGFSLLGLVEGWKSANIDPADFSAHRFLAESYAALPRHEIATVSELLQSQLLQPINVNPVLPRLAQSDLFFLNGAGPAVLGFNEFNPLFTQNRLALQVNGVLGQQGTLGEEIVQSGVVGGFSYSLGQFHYQTDGFRKNNDLEQNLYDVFGQMSLSYQTSIQAEFRSTDVDKGDLQLRFFPNDFSPNLRDETEKDSFRVGLHHAFSPGSDLIASFMYQNAEYRTSDVTFPVSVNFKTDKDSYSGELQHLLRRERFDLISGAGYFHIGGKEEIALLIPGLTIEPTSSGIDVDHTNLYFYSTIHYPRTVNVMIGASADFFQGGITDANQVNPKVGITWNPFPDTTMRGALFRTFKRTLITDQTLEPTQVAGFNQFYDDVDETEAWQYGLAIDQKFHTTLYGGVEASKRDLEVLYEDISPSAPPTAEEVDWEERLVRAYLYWTPHPWFALTGEYQYEELERGRDFNANTAEHVETHRVPLGINFYHPCGLSANLAGTYTYQKGKFVPQGFPQGAPGIPGEDRFWLVDAALSYRLPKRYGMLAIVGRNLFDKSFKFMDTDPTGRNLPPSPAIQPERLVVFKYTFSF